MEELCPGVWILDNVQELVLVVLQDTRATVVVPKHHLRYCSLAIISFQGCNYHSRILSWGWSVKHGTKYFTSTNQNKQGHRNPKTSSSGNNYTLNICCVFLFSVAEPTVSRPSNFLYLFKLLSYVTGTVIKFNGNKKVFISHFKKISNLMITDAVCEY